MLGYILLRGKDFSLPDGVSTAIIGLFFGLVCGLFYYQRYYRPYYWSFSLAGGFAFTFLCHEIFLRNVTSDDGRALQMTLVSFALPFLLTLALNHTMSLMKSRKRRQHSNRKTHSSFFDTTNAGEILVANAQDQSLFQEPDKSQPPSRRSGRKRKVW